MKDQFKKSSIPILFVPLSEIVVKENLNPRISLPDIDSLVDSMKQYGIQEPLKVYYDPEIEKYVVVKGHRRIQASKVIADAHGIAYETVDIPCSKYNSIPDAETILRDHLISNSGVPFTAIEKAEIVNRYMALGFTITEIAPKMNLTYQQTYNLEILHNAPPEIKEMIQEGLIASTLVIEEFKAKKNFNAILEIFKTILLEGAAKITSKKVKELEDRYEQEEEENEENLKNSFNNEQEAPNKTKFEDRVSMLSEELKLEYNDRDPERNEKIDWTLDLFGEIQQGTEISVIIKSLFPIKPKTRNEIVDLAMNPEKESFSETLKAKSEAKPSRKKAESTNEEITDIDPMMESINKSKSKSKEVVKDIHGNPI